MGMAGVSVGPGHREGRMLPPVATGGGPMARRTFDVVDVTEILAHWYAGRSKNQISESLGLDRKTVRKYLAPAEAGGPGTGRAASQRAGVAGAGRGMVPGDGRCGAAA